jgi:hypothetical protein
MDRRTPTTRTGAGTRKGAGIGIPGPPRVSLLALAAAVAGLLLALVPAQRAEAQTPPYDRGIDAACLEGARAADPFVDIGPAATHGEAVACLWVYGIAQGRFVTGDNVYDPAATVTRQQMASFVARTLAAVPDSVYTLPEGDDDVAYDDAAQISDAHVFAVSQLTQAGIVEGFADGTFRPAQTLNRAQMASFIARALEVVTADTLDRADVFPDATGTHQASIEKLAAIGVTAGTVDGRFAPAEPITRAQMGSFLARSLDFLAAEGLLQPVDYDPGTAPPTLGLTGVDVAVQDDFDRVTFTLEGDERFAGWRVQYVDEARAVGTGDLIDVEGDAIIRVILTGMALPPDLPDDIEDRVMDVLDEATFVLGGDAIVEVVLDGPFEGQQQVFIGTTGQLPFTVERLDDPQRVYVDVFHGS